MGKRNPSIFHRTKRVMGSAPVCGADPLYRCFGGMALLYGAMTKNGLAGAGRRGITQDEVERT